jgi:hypothetical protein
MGTPERKFRSTTGFRMTATHPTIRQVALLHGKSIDLANVQVEDAEFILSLRLDPGKSRYLSPLDGEIEKQRDWIRAYLQSEGQAYFIIRDKAAQRYGTVRIYDAVGDSFSWGSWVLRNGAPPAAAIESALLVYRLAIADWGFRSAHFKVHRANTSVLDFHQRFGAHRTQETDQEVQLRIGLPEIERSLKRYARYLPARILVE